MAYRIVEIELSEAAKSFTLEADEDGFALIARWNGRLAGFHMASAAPAADITAELLTELCGKHFGRRALVLLRHKFLRFGFFRAQHGHRGMRLTRAAINRHRIVAIEFGM